MSAGTLAECLAALTELTELARVYRDAATVQGRPGSAQSWAQLAGKLDSARTTLIQEGAEYLEVAWAFVDSGRYTVARMVAADQRRPSAGNTLDVSLLARRDDSV